MDELKPIILLVTGGLLIRYSLILAGQAWARSHSQTISFILLPIITFIITKTISGNIALSLGMIGALSIVRFRHPVKSAIELVLYFDLITIGIATSVRTKWSIQLIICTVLIILAVTFLQKILKSYGKSFYNISFNEGISSNILEIESKTKIEQIESSKNLINIIADNSINKYVYRLGFEDSQSLKMFKKNIEGEVGIEKINAIFN